MARILLAEDDSSMRHFLAQALQRAGHEVRAEKDGLRALRALDSDQEFDLLLSDIVMPGIDGVELAQLAMNRRPGMKVMFITGFAAVAMAQETPANKNARVLSKPFHLNDLVGQVETLLKAA